MDQLPLYSPWRAADPQKAAAAEGALRAQREIEARVGEDNLAKGLCAHGFAPEARTARGKLVCPTCRAIEAEGLDR